MSQMQEILRKKYAQRFDEAYQILNDEQRQAVDAIEGPVMVIAGPGTGKTQILAVRIGKILQQQDVQPHNILCLTYTDAAVIAMRKRLVKIIGPDGHKVHIYTFHGFCNQVIQENLDYFGNYRQLEPLEDLEKIDVYKEIIDNLPNEHPLKRPKGDGSYEAKRLESLFAMLKRENISPEEMLGRIESHLKEKKESPEFICKRKTTLKTGKVYLKDDFRDDKYQTYVEKFTDTKLGTVLLPKYVEIMDRRGRYDYADMILWVIDAFNNNDSILATYQERYQYFLVDEYQDTNGAQNDVLYMLIDFMDLDPNVFVVGDDDQAIYKFQGANLNNIRDFKSKYNPLTVVLEKNYRSHQEILDDASSLINFNQERIIKDTDITATKNLIAAKKIEKPIIEPVLRVFKNVIHEQAHLVEILEEMQKNNEPLNEVAVIYRKHSEVNKISEVLEKKEIPINIKKKVDILKLPLVKNILNVLYYIQSEYDKPNSEENRLFELMHYQFFHIDSRDIAKIAMHCRTGTYKNPIYWRDVISDRKLLKDIGVSQIEEIDRLQSLLTVWVGDIANVTLQMLFQSVLNDGHILQYVLSSANKTWLLQVISTMFDSIKEQSNKKPDIKLKDYLENIDKMKAAELPMSINKIVSSKEGVHFMTAHSAKGLEFEKVFMIGCNKQTWDSSRGGFNQYNYPDNVNMDTVTNDEDERRLFFVSMTRAKSELYISFSEKRENDKDLNPSQFIDEIIATTDRQIDPVDVDKDLLNDFQSYLLLKENKKATLIDKDRIDEVLKGYKLSVTGLSKYLKCPMTYYFETILRVPTARNSNMGFGRAMHKAMQLYFDNIKDDKKPNKDDFLKYFERGMLESVSHFTDKEFKKLSEYGKLVLGLYHKEYLENLELAKDYGTEIQIDNVEWESVPLKGVLDLVVIHKDHIHVVDYKTGNGFSADKSKIKKPTASNVHGGDYWRQMVYYKILTDSDRKYNWKMISGEMDFLEPKRGTSEFTKTQFTISPTDIEMVGEQIVETWKNIHDHNFNNLCENEKCYWCNFVRDEYVFSGEFDRDALEDNQDF